MATCEKCGAKVAEAFDDTWDGPIPAWMELGIGFECSDEEAWAIHEERNKTPSPPDPLSYWEELGKLYER